MEALCERDKGKATGLPTVPKLKFEQINLTPFAKMRVDLAAQVSSCKHVDNVEYIIAGSE